MKQEDWTQQLRQQLADYEVAAPDDLWASIESAVDAAQHRHHRLVVMRRWAVAASLAALVVGGAWWWYPQQEAPAPHDTAAIVADTRQDSQPQVPEPQPVVDLPAEALIQKEQRPAIVAVAAQPAAEAAPAPTVPADVAPTETVSTEHPTGSTPLGQKTLAKQEHPAPDSHRPSPSRPHPSPASQPPTPHTYHPRPALALYASNGLADERSHNPVLMGGGLMSDFQYGQSVLAANTSHRALAPILLAGHEEHEHHYQPLSLGLTVSLPLLRRLSLTTGIVYTRQRSDFTTLMWDSQIEQTQTLHYLGVPVSLRYQLLAWRGLELYGAAGLQADWNVSARLQTAAGQQSIARDRMLWSVSGSLGMQYNLLPHVGLYAEPGISYYFDNGSPLRNYTKQHPGNLHLQAGIRLNL